MVEHAPGLTATQHRTYQHALNERNAVLYQINKFPGVVVLICDKIEVLPLPACLLVKDHTRHAHTHTHDTHTTLTTHTTHTTHTR
jgi:hypothetical protein